VDIIRVRWLDTCLRTRVGKKSLLEEAKPMFESYGVDFGVCEYQGKEYRKIVYCFHFMKGSDDNVISYIPVGCILSIKKIAKVDYAN